MRFALRTLRQVHCFRRSTEGRLGAQQVAICGACGFRWPVDLDTACRELGDEATGMDLVDTANCPHCSGGQAKETYLVIDTEPSRRPAWFGSQFDGILDTVNHFGTMKPRRR